MRLTCFYAGILLVFGLFGLTGCGSNNAVTESKFKPKDSMNELAEMMKQHTQSKKRPPKTYEELEYLEPGFTQAYAALLREDIVMFWGFNLSTQPDAGSKILAYEKEVPTNRGWVLMLDGTVKEMTSSEFSNAPKAKK
jgi:hypothetical protein